MNTGPVGAENLRDEATFVNYAPGAIAPGDPELIQIRDAVEQLPQRRCGNCPTASRIWVSSGSSGAIAPGA